MSSRGETECTSRGSKYAEISVTLCTAAHGGMFVDADRFPWFIIESYISPVMKH
jgi:hypothetical protein